MSMDACYARRGDRKQEIHASRMSRGDPLVEYVFRDASAFAGGLHDCIGEAWERTGMNDRVWSRRCGEERVGTAVRERKC